MAVNGTSCRPPYEERSARISILANGIAARPDTFVQTVRASCKNHLPTGRAIRYRPLPSDALSRAWSRSFVCLWIVRFPQARGTGFPRRHAAPSAQSDYRSLSEVHTRAGNRTTTAAFQNMHDTADDAAVVRPLDAPYIRRQMRFDPSPLLVAQPKQVPAHNPDPLPTTNQDRIVRAKKLMSSDPSLAVSPGCIFQVERFERRYW